MFQHQIHNSIGQDIYNAYEYTSTSFASHLHKGCEFLYVEKGILQAEIGDKKYFAKTGEWLFCPPYSIHAYTSSPENLYLAIVFSGEETEDFVRFLDKQRPMGYLFKPSKETADFALKILWRDRDKIDLEVVKRIEKPDPLSLKAALYALCAEFTKEQTFENIPTMENSLLFDCLQYIENNFTVDISLKSMAHSLGYAHEYISRVFHRAFHASFKDFVNQYRLELAQRLILSTNLPLTEIVHESGFQSIRSFNRIFKEQMGVAPSEFRKNH